MLEQKVYKNWIVETLQSTAFNKQMIIVNKNFSNLKQEGHIRNTLLILLNEMFEQQNLRYLALSEYPRINHGRTDLSLTNLCDLSIPFKIELKFQMKGDFVGHKNLAIRSMELEKDLFDKQSDLFMLIIIEWDDEHKEAYDRKIGLDSSLVKFNDNKMIDTWENGVEQVLSQRCRFTKETVIIDEPYFTKYHFYLVSAK